MIYIEKAYLSNGETGIVLEEVEILNEIYFMTSIRWHNIIKDEDIVKLGSNFFFTAQSDQHYLRLDNLSFLDKNSATSTNKLILIEI